MQKVLKEIEEIEACCRMISQVRQRSTELITLRKT